MNVFEEALKRIKTIRNQLFEMQTQYYTLQTLPFSTKEYEALLQELQNLEESFPTLKIAHSPTTELQILEVKKFPTVMHHPPMLSLNNRYSWEEVQDWQNKIVRDLQKEEDHIELEYCCELKIDGLAVTVIYEKGCLVKAATRGDGTQGDDITANLKTIPELPLQLKEPIDLQVRGEVYLAHEQFQKLNQAMQKQGLPPFKNPRNAASGSLRLQDAAEVSHRKLSLFLYAVVDSSLPAIQTHSQHLETLLQLGLPINPIFTTCQNLDDADQFCSKWEHERHGLPYDIDGIVIKLNHYRHHEMLGSSAKSPHWAIAYKFKAEQVLSQLLDIEIGVGRTGVLTPVAILKPIILNQTKVARATLHNYTQIEKFDLHIGDTVILEKGGEIIPKIVDVRLEKRPSDAQKIYPPASCPSCESLAVLVGVEWRCLNSECRTKKIEQVLHFVSRKAMDIDHVGEALIKQLFETNLIHDSADLYSLGVEQLLQLEKIADTSANNVVNAIQSSKSRPLHALIFALGIPSIGEKTAYILAQNFLSLDKLQDVEQEELCNLENIEQKTAQEIRRFFQNQTNQQLIQKLKNHGLNPQVEVIETKTIERVTGKTFVLTGALTEPRHVWQQRLEQHRAKVTNTVSKKTDYVIVGENAGSKQAKAEKLGIPTLTEETISKWLHEPYQEALFQADEATEI